MNIKKALFVMAMGLAVTASQRTFAGALEDFATCKHNAAAKEKKCEADDLKPDITCEKEELDGFAACRDALAAGKRAEFKACVQRALDKQAKETHAARVAFRAVQITIDQFLKEFVRTKGKLGLMFPAHTSKRDQAIKKATDDAHKAIAQCK